MAEEQNHSLPADGQDTMMVYINPQLIQSLADVSAKKERSFRELLDAAEEGDLEIGRASCRERVSKSV